MKLAYHADTDSLYVEFTERPSVESTEIAAGVVVDFDFVRFAIYTEIYYCHACLPLLYYRDQNRSSKLQ